MQQTSLQKTRAYRTNDKKNYGRPAAQRDHEMTFKKCAKRECRFGEDNLHLLVFGGGGVWGRGTYNSQEGRKEGLDEKNYTTETFGRKVKLTSLAPSLIKAHPRCVTGM